jgi:hypothetical protein
MQSKLTFFIALLIAGCLLGSASGQEKSRADKKRCTPISALAYEDGVPTITLEALFKEPDCYEGKFIRTYGFFRSGDEISQLYCLDCESSGLIWLDFEEFYPANKRCVAGGGNKDTFGKTVGFAALGVFRTGGGFGHLNGSRHKFSVICIDEVTVLAKDWSVPQSLPEKTLRQMRDWYKKASEKY